MPTLQERMNDAAFTVRTPICAMCKNRIRHKFDALNPLAPVMTCKVFGEIPPDLWNLARRECERFELDSEEARKFEGLE